MNEKKISENTKQITELRNKFDVWRNEANNMIVKVQDIASQKRVEIRDEIAELKNKYESLNKDFIELVNLIKNIKEFTSQEPTLQDYFLKQKYHDIEELNKKIKDLGSEKEEVLKGSIPTKDLLVSQSSYPDSKLPECSECGGFHMGENIQIHKEGCSQSPTTTTAEKLPKEVIFAGIYDYIKTEPEKNCTTCESVYTLPPSPCATCRDFSNWSPSKRLDIINVEKLTKKAVKIRKKYPNFNDYILKFMEAGEKIMSKDGFTQENGYKVMKEAIELCNPNKDILKAEEYMNNMSNELMTFMDNCFDYIISDYELNKGKKSLIKTQYEKQMKRQ